MNASTSINPKAIALRAEAEEWRTKATGLAFHWKNAEGRQCLAFPEAAVGYFGASEALRAKAERAEIDAEINLILRVCGKQVKP